jgi:hypothetical protein
MVAGLSLCYCKCPSLKRNLAIRRAVSGLSFVTPVRGRSGLGFAIK